MKKKLSVLAAGIMAVGTLSMTPVSASETQVTVGVTDTKPKVISVDVPTNFAMAVVTDKVAPTVAPELLMGSTTLTIGGQPGVSPTNPASAEATLTFTNKGVEDAKIEKATITNVAGSGWTLTSGAAAAHHEMNLDFGGMKLGSNVTPGGAADMTGTAIDLPNSKGTPVLVKGTVGGTNADYTNAADAVAYHVTWVISAK